MTDIWRFSLRAVVRDFRTRSMFGHLLVRLLDDLDGIQDAFLTNIYTL